MAPIMDRLQPLDSDVRVDLRSGERSVTEQLLNGAQICSSFQQMGRGAVPQAVRTHVWRARHRTDHVVHNGPNDPLIDSSTARSQEQRRC